MQIGIESFYEVDAESVAITSQESGIIEWKVIPHTDAARTRLPSESNRLNPRYDTTSVAVEKSSSIISRHVLSWCRANPGYAVLLGGPIHLSSSHRTRRFLLPEEGLVSFGSETGRCLDDAALNSVVRLVSLAHAVRMNSILKREEIRNGRESRKNLGALRPLLHKCNKFLKQGKLETTHLNKKFKTDFRRNPFAWFAEYAPPGIWIVRIVESGVVDHTVVVDTRDALIIDSAEQHPLALMEESLRLCGSDDSTNLMVAEVRQLVLQK